jgi:hypothetical protein
MRQPTMTSGRGVAPPRHRSQVSNPRSPALVSHSSLQGTAPHSAAAMAAAADRGMEVIPEKIGIGIRVASPNSRRRVGSTILAAAFPPRPSSLKRG